MDRQAILQRLHAEAPALRKKYGVKSLAVFGSMARGDDHEGSDVDILVTFEDRPTFDNFFGLKSYLEDLFDRPVDLGTPTMVRPGLLPLVEKEAIRVPVSPRSGSPTSSIAARKSSDTRPAWIKIGWPGTN